MMSITTTHSLAKELLDKPDGFLYATDGEHDYVVNTIRRVPTCNNIDDRCMNWALYISSCDGEIKR